MLALCALSEEAADRGRGSNVPPQMNPRMHYLITGGCGFIGCNFIRGLLADEPGARVTNVDALTLCGE